MSRICVAILILTALLACAASADLPGLKRDMTYKKTDRAVEVTNAERLVARYVFKDTTKPFIYPVVTPSGKKVTRGFPIETIAGEAQDHPDQRSFWIGYGNVNGIDFWGEGEKSGKIVQTSLDFDSTSPGYWAIHTKNDWIGPDGNKVCEDERYVSFLSCDYGTLISTLISIKALAEPLKFGNSSQGFLALRLAKGMQVKGGTGKVLFAEKSADKKATTRRAAWCDYSGQIDGQSVGVTLFDSPWNHGYPAYMVAEDHGLMAINPFGGLSFTGDAKNDSSLEIPPYDVRTFVYMTLIHDGTLNADAINKMVDRIAGRGAGKKPTGDSADPPKPDVPATP